MDGRQVIKNVIIDKKKTQWCDFFFSQSSKLNPLLVFTKNLYDYVIGDNLNKNNLAKYRENLA